MNDTPKVFTENDLDQLLNRVAAQDLAVPDALFDKIMLDADQVLRGQLVVRPADEETRAQYGAAMLSPAAGTKIRKRDIFGQFLDLIGGWPAFSGLSMAAATGLWIGVAPPEMLDSLAAGLWGSTIEMPVLGSDLYQDLEG